MFIIYAAIALLDTRYFAKLKPAADAQPLPAPKGKGWYWGGLAFGAIVGMILYPILYAWCSKSKWLSTLVQMFFVFSGCSLYF